MKLNFLKALLGLLGHQAEFEVQSDFPDTNVSVPQVTLTLTAPPNYTPGLNLPVTPQRVDNAPKSQTSSHCLVVPRGWGQDDAPQIQAAVSACGTDGIITLAAPYVYTIKSRMYLTLVRSRLNVYGTLSFAADLGYWIQNSHRIEFQNQSTALIIEGQDYLVDGGGWMQGGIDGNGQAWYTYAKGQSNVFGRPVSMSIFNSSNATIQNFSIRNPQFWSFWIQDSHDVTLSSIYINGTNTDPQGNASDYEINIDGFDSIRVNNLLVQDWLFHGGDDCAAPKGNSTNMVFRNMTCIGGGIAFGSVGQYVDAPDYIMNVSVSDVSVRSMIFTAYGGADGGAGAYFKSWVGVAAGTPPQGGGGGTGRVSNVSFTNLHVENTTQAVYINKAYYKVASQANYSDTSTFEFANLSFENVTGSVSGRYSVNLNCSAAAPCRDIVFEGLDVSVSGSNDTITVECDNTEGLKGLVCS